jgi:HEAT repeat protein
LGLFKDERIVEPLIKVLQNQDENADVQDCAVNALGRSGDPRAIDALIAALESKNAMVCADAAYWVSASGDPEEAPAHAGRSVCAF